MIQSGKLNHRIIHNNRTKIVKTISNAMLFVICLQAFKLILMSLLEQDDAHANTYWFYHFLNFCFHCLLFIYAMRLNNTGGFSRARAILIIAFCSYLFWACILWQADVGLHYYFILSIFICSYLFSGQEVRQMIVVSGLMAFLFLYFSFSLPNTLHANDPSFYGLMQNALDIPSYNIALNKRINNMGFIFSCCICVYYIRQILSRHWHKLQVLQRNQQNLLKKIFPTTLAEQLTYVNESTLNFNQELGVIFVDICNFSEMLKSPTQEPDSWKQFYKLYDDFDNCLSNLDARRIKINGDQYIVIIGLNRTYCQKQIANCVIEACFLLQKHSQMSIKIGASLGQVSIGIFDTNHPQFDIWGQTVIRAARLEQTAEANQIFIDSAIHLNNTIIDATIFKQEKNLKGIGKQTTFEISHFIC
ncbi:adenylate/guanylate cyclase domain-containing protein [Glaciecola petra]|uniref:adenylate cyclase n=1 Tax=Glaciecola petra TaxID=3075602 RepID=A0ABU2ZPN5_9ALTE|nr:adenylate/guanylate cyclase domain-containing protein [Aestuariibacter sp. P117]MDT0594008.1 adenylate/guanylate cyclase domain-containing protein [Aestuariibacter sp. P117]